MENQNESVGASEPLNTFSQSEAREYVSKLLNHLEPVLHQVYNTHYMHDVEVMKNFIQLNMWKSVADRATKEMIAKAEDEAAQALKNQQNENLAAVTTENQEASASV